MTKTGMVASALVLGLWTAALAVQAAEQVKTIEVNRPLRGLECVRYKAVAHFKPEQGSVTLDCTLKFAADKIVKLEDVKSSAQATYTFLTFVLNRGHRITVGYSTLKGRLFLYAYETASRRHVFIEEFGVGWKEGERHRITVSWGAFLTLRLDGRKWFSQAWRGLGGPWGDQPVNRDAPYLLVGTQEGWTHTQSDFFVHTVSFDPNPPPGIVQLLQEHSGGPAALPRATVAIPRLAQPPRLDGVVEDQEWAGAAKVTGLVNIQTMLAMGDLTCFLVGYDEQRLYLGIVAFGREAQSADAACHTRDGKVYLDDAVEIFLQPDAKGPHYQFIGNSFAAIYDGFDGNNGWNGNWNYRTSRREDRWMGEAAIAWTELGRRGPPQPGETWGINFCRELPMMSEIASWALMHRGYIQPDRFGRASFVAAGPFARLDGVEGAARGELSVSLNAICPRPYAGPPIEAELVVADESAILIRKKVALPPDQTAKVSLGERVMPGEYVLTYQVGAAGANLLAGTYAFSTSPPFQVAVKRYPTLGYVEAALDTRGMSALPTGAKARAAILDAQANALNSAESAQPGAENTFNLRLATERVAVGPFRVRGELLDGAGRVLHSATLEQEKRPAPWWLNSKAGVTRTVLPPWTPMKVTRPLAVSCWGRDVSYRDAVLPTSIVSNGKDLLAAPMRFVARVAGKTVELQQGKADVKASAEDAVDLATAAEAGGLRVNTTAHFEYDGLIRVEAALSGASVDSLALEIPLKAEHSILMHENDGGRGWAGLTGDAKREMVFRPVVWLGDDERGLCWFTESAQGWAPIGSGNIEIEAPREGVRLLRLNLRRQPTSLAQPLKYTFGLMATPVRPRAYTQRWRLGTGPTEPGQGHLTNPERVVYPVAGQFDLRAGSLEVVMQPVWPKEADAMKPYLAWQEIAGTQWGDWLRWSRLGVQYHPGQRTLVVQERRVVSDPKAKAGHRDILVAKDVALVPGETYHLTLTWGEELALHLDGKPLGRVAQRGLIAGEAAGPLENQTLQLGGMDDFKGCTAFLFDELKVSGRTLTPSEVAARAGQPLAADADTLLLDHFDDQFRPDGEDARTQPAVSRAADGGGVPSIGCRFAAAKFGRGIEVHVRPPSDWLRYAHDVLGVTHATDWQWHKFMGGWDLLHAPQAYRDRVQRVHDAGMDYYVYTYKAIALRHPDYPEFFDEWALLPRTRWIDPRPQEAFRNYDADSVCCHSAYTDYFVAAYEKTLKDYRLDGIYLDGSNHPSLCANAHHGCGYRDEAGQWRGTYPIFATREYLKRLYAVTHLSNPEGIVDIHSSFALCIPTQSFCDIVYTGEHEPFRPDLMDEVRVRYAWRAWGPEIECLGSTPAYLRYAARYWAYLLPHDARVRAGATHGRNDIQRKVAAIRKVLEPYRQDGCTWHPYFKPGPFTCAQRGVYVSAWGKSANDCLLVVSYLGDSPPKVTAEVKIALTGPWKAVNALTDQAYALERDTLRVPVEFERFRLVRLTRIKGAD